MPAGRPSTYPDTEEGVKELCERVIEWGGDGKSKVWIAGKLGIAKQTLYNWEERHPEFMDALSRAMTLSQMWWEDAGQSGMTSDKFNSTIWSKNMAARFREEWTDTQNVNHGAQDSLAQLMAQIDGTAGRIPTARP